MINKPTIIIIYILLFQRFIMILSEHLVKCDTDGIPFNTHWYKYTIGRLQQVFLAVSISFFFFFFPQRLNKTWFLLILLIISYLILFSASWTSSKVQQHSRRITFHSGFRHSYPRSIPSILSTPFISYIYVNNVTL